MSYIASASKMKVKILASSKCIFFTTNHTERKISSYSLLKAVNWVLMEQVKFIDLQKMVPHNNLPLIWFYNTLHNTFQY